MSDLLDVPTEVLGMVPPGTSNLQKYLSRNPILRRAVRQFLRAVADLAGLCSPRSILEVGCGEGFVLRALRDTLPNPSVHGCDVDLRPLRLARSIVPGALLFVGDVLHLPVRRSSYDLVVCCEVLEHLSDPRAGLNALESVSRRHVLLSVPHEPFFSWANLARGRHILRGGNPPEHLNQWTGRSFRALVEETMRIVTIRRPFPWFVVLAEVRR